MFNELSPRKRAILKAVVDAYIESGDPVGSKTLTQGRQFGLSSATIRNEMAELESLGYLEQPHTSAGRVPSESGYRFYVDSLMKEYALNAGELAELNSMLKAKTAELDKLIQNAGRVMANLTNYTAIAVKQSEGRDTVTRFSVTPVDDRNFLLVMICSDRSAKTRFIHTENPVEEVAAAHDILFALGFDTKKRLNIVSCPTCGRTRIDLISLASRVEAALRDCKKPITVAVMGCVVNGPGEAREADVGIAGGDGVGMLFAKGEMIQKLPYDELLPALLSYIDTL